MQRWSHHYHIGATDVGPYSAYYPCFMLCLYSLKWGHAGENDYWPITKD